MIDLSNFKTFDFSEGVPYISITSNGITFNKSVIMKMKYPAYVKLLINETEKQIDGTQKILLIRLQEYAIGI